MARDRGEGLGDSLLKGVDGAGFGFTEKGFDFAPHALDRIEIRAVRGQEEDSGARLGDDRDRFLVLVPRCRVGAR